MDNGSYYFYGMRVSILLISGLIMKNIFQKYLAPDSVFTLISIFFLVFGITLFVALLFTTSEKGAIVNAICGCFFIVSAFLSAIISKKSNDGKK